MGKPLDQYTEENEDYDQEWMVVITEEDDQVNTDETLSKIKDHNFLIQHILLKSRLRSFRFIQWIG